MKFYMIWNRKTQDWMSNSRWSRQGGERKRDPVSYTNIGNARRAVKGFLGDPSLTDGDLVIVEFAGMPINPPPDVPFIYAHGYKTVGPVTDPNERFITG